MEFPTVDSSSNDPLAVADLHDASIAVPRQVTSDRVQIQFLGKLLPELESAFDSIQHKLLVLLGYFTMLLRHLIGMIRVVCHVPLDRGESTRLHQRAEAVRRRLEPCERSEKSERHRNYQMLIAWEENEEELTEEDKELTEEEI